MEQRTLPDTTLRAEISDRSIARPGREQTSVRSNNIKLYASHFVLAKPATAETLRGARAVDRHAQIIRPVELPDRHQRLHRTYVSVPRSLDHVSFGSMSFRAILARQKRPSAAHMAATRHRFAASRATNPKSHSPLAVFAARELMTSGAFRPVRHRPISSVQRPIKLESARTLGGSGTLRR